MNRFDVALGKPREEEEPPRPDVVETLKDKEGGIPVDNLGLFTGHLRNQTIAVDIARDREFGVVNHITNDRLMVAPSLGSLTITCPNGYQTTIALRNINAQMIVDQFNENSGHVGGSTWLQIALPAPIIQAILNDIQETRRRTVPAGGPL